MVFSEVDPRSISQRALLLQLCLVVRQLAAYLAVHAQQAHGRGYRDFCC